MLHLLLFFILSVFRYQRGDPSSSWSVSGTLLCPLDHKFVPQLWLIRLDPRSCCVRVSPDLSYRWVWRESRLGASQDVNRSFVGRSINHTFAVWLRYLQTFNGTWCLFACVQNRLKSEKAEKKQLKSGVFSPVKLHCDVFQAS